MKKLKKLSLIFGLVFLLSTSLVFVLTFLVAYFNNYEVFVTINDYGEAHIELFLIMAGLPFAFLFVRDAIISFRRRTT